MAQTLGQAFSSRGWDINTRRNNDGTGGITMDQEKELDNWLLRSVKGYTTVDRSSDDKLELARQNANAELMDVAPIAYKWGATGVGERSDDELANAPQVTAYRSGIGEGGQGRSSGASSASMPPAQAWNQQPQQQAPAQSAPQNELYKQLMARMTQSTQVDPSDATIRPQVDAYRAEQERARRNFLSDQAEAGGPRINLTGQERITSEKLGQNVGAFQAELQGREQMARRDEIAQALQMSAGLLSNEETRALQRELAALDQEIKRGQLALGGQDLALRGELGRGGLDIQRGGLNLQRDLGLGGLDLQRELGRGGLDLQRRGLNQNMEQFLRELAQRQYEFDDTSDWRWAGL